MRDTSNYRTSKLGPRNPQWKGDDVSLKVLHVWVRRRLVEPDCCTACGLNKRLDLANISQEYKRDLDDWEYLCRSCHMKKDGRLQALLDKSYNNKYCVGRVLSQETKDKISAKLKGRRLT